MPSKAKPMNSKGFPNLKKRLSTLVQETSFRGFTKKSTKPTPDAQSQPAPKDRPEGRNNIPAKVRDSLLDDAVLGDFKPFDIDLSTLESFSLSDNRIDSQLQDQTSSTPIADNFTRNSSQDNREHETHRRWRGVYEDEDDMLVDEEVSDDQSSTSGPKQPRSPEKAKQGKARQRADSPVFQTEEELQEHKRQQNQIDILKAELCRVRPESHEPLQDEKLDQIYIFQFPPKLPNLINPSTEVKDEPESPPTLPTNQPLAGYTAAIPASSVTQNSLPIKIEDDVPSSKTTTFSFSRSTHLPTLTPGLVGKLKIHNSGKATLDWGGTSLHLNKAIDASFVQDVIMVRPATQQSANTRSEVGGEALAFGQVRGKFAVAPDWEGMLG